MNIINQQEEPKELSKAQLDMLRLSDGILALIDGTDLSPCEILGVIEIVKITFVRSQPI